MREQLHDGLSLFDPSGSRKYLNASERRRFLESAQQLPPPERLFCHVLAWSGARISEALALTPDSIDIESGVANIRTLKRPKRGVVRQVPLPSHVLNDLDREFELRSAQHDPVFANKRIWHFSRTTAWRRLKEVMVAAGIAGTPAMPNGRWSSTRRGAGNAQRVRGDPTRGIDGAGLFQCRSARVQTLGRSGNGQFQRCRRFENVWRGAGQTG